MHKWELEFEDIVFALTNDEFSLAEIEDRDMRLAVAVVVDRVEYISALSYEDARKSLALIQLLKVDELHSILKDRIEHWQANNWKRIANV